MSVIDKLLFGISGLPIGNGQKFNYASAISYLKELGLYSMEMLFFRSVYVSDKNKDEKLKNKLANEIYLYSHSTQ